MGFQSGLLDQMIWLDFKNNNAALVPAFGIMRSTGYDVSDPDFPFLNCDQSNSYGDVGTCFINGPYPVPAASTSNPSYGRCTRSGVVLALYDSADGTPVYGDMWGPRSGTWKLKKNTGGFFCLGAPTNATQFLALFAPLPMDLLLVKNTSGSTIAQGTQGSVQIMTGVFGSEAPSGLFVTALARTFDFKNAAIGRAICDKTAAGFPNWEIITSTIC